jgi:hypothetical protein
MSESDDDCSQDNLEEEELYRDVYFREGDKDKEM